MTTTESARTQGSVPLDAVLGHVDLAVEGVCATLLDLGDELANRRPDLPGANSVYAIVTHLCGVMEHWGGTEIAGRVVDRDRDAEFVATGDVVGLADRIRTQRDRFVADIAAAGGGAGFDGSRPALRAHERDGYTADERVAVATMGGVLLHVYEELAQHRGQIDVTADLVRAEAAQAR